MGPGLQVDETDEILVHHDTTPEDMARSQWANMGVWAPLQEIAPPKQLAELEQAFAASVRETASGWQTPDGLAHPHHMLWCSATRPA